MKFPIAATLLCLQSTVISAYHQRPDYRGTYDQNPVINAGWSFPSASVAWNDFHHIRVYGIDPNGEVREWQWDNNGRWTGPSYIGAKAKPGTGVTAIVDSNNGIRLRVYYTGNDDGRIHERMYEDGWSDGSVLP